MKSGQRFKRTGAATAASVGAWIATLAICASAASADEEDARRLRMAMSDYLWSEDNLTDAVRDTYGLPFPAADLLGSARLDALKNEVSEVKDLGSGVAGASQCDHLAFRAEVVDSQIWIAQGDVSNPCIFVITTRGVPQAPQYSLGIRDWQSAADGAHFTLSATDGVTEVDFEAFAATVQTFPDHFTLEETA